MKARSYLLAICSVSCSLVLAGVGHGQTTQCVSLDPQGVVGNQGAGAPILSDNGRFVAFDSPSNNLVPGDTNFDSDVFVYDRQTRATERVSVDSNGNQLTASSYGGPLSANGRHVAFISSAKELLLPEGASYSGIFVHDRQTGVTEFVCKDSLGIPANGACFAPAISGDGRFVAFHSFATNLVPDDTNGLSDVFVHDRLTGSTERVSVDSAGLQSVGLQGSIYASISLDGTVVAFSSYAANLVPGDTNLNEDVFVHNRDTGETKRVSVSTSGMEANANADSPTLSADGNLVGFTSLSTNLVPGDTNGAYDIFVHDCTAGTTERVSITSDQQEAVGVIGSNSPKISSDGNHIAFASRSTNLVAGDDNLFSDVFVHDIQTGITSLVSVNSEGQSGNSISGLPTISGDGGFVAFYSWADMFTAKDTNGVTDAFVRDRWNGEGTNSIYLAGPSVSEVPKPLGFTWQTSHGNARYWLSYSSSNQGSTFGGHPLDLGAPSSILTAGVTSPSGLGRFQTRRVSPALVGQTLYFELTCLDGAGTLYDSNVHGVTFR